MNEYRTVSILKKLTDDIQRLMVEVGYWPNISSFVREASLEKLYLERMKLKSFKEEKKDEE